MGSEAVSFLPEYLICVDEFNAFTVRGKLYCGSGFGGGVGFDDVSHLLLQIDNIMDTVSCPFAGNNLRSFVKEKENFAPDRKKKKESLKAMRKLNVENGSGKVATFVLHVKFRQNSSWQGTVKWVEKKQELSFRSALELIKIIDSACEQGYQANLVELDREII